MGLALLTMLLCGGLASLELSALVACMHALLRMHASLERTQFTQHALRMHRFSVDNLRKQKELRLAPSSKKTPQQTVAAECFGRRSCCGRELLQQPLLGSAAAPVAVAFCIELAACVPLLLFQLFIHQRKDQKQMITPSRLRLASQLVA